MFFFNKTDNLPNETVALDSLNQGEDEVIIGEDGDSPPNADEQQHEVVMMVEQEADEINTACRDAVHIYPRRNEFALKLAAVSATQIVTLSVALCKVWTHFSINIEEREFYASKNYVWDLAKTMGDANLWELAVMLYFGVVLQPICKVVSGAVTSYIFYEGMGHGWTPNPGVNYAHSCSEEDILPWNRPDVNYGVRTLSGRMKIATSYVNSIPIMSKISFVQNIVCAFILYLLTFDLEERNVTLEGRTQFELGAVMFVLCTISTMGYAALLRWQLNNWMRWFKEKHKDDACIDAPLEGIDSGDTDGTETPASLAEPLLLNEESDDVNNFRQQRRKRRLSALFQNRHHLRFSQTKQYSWYAAAAGASISWLALVCGVYIFDVDFTGSLAEGFKEPHREETYASFVIDQFTYDGHSPFLYRLFLFLAFAVMGFFIPTIAMFLCVTIEACNDYSSLPWFRDLVNTLQYMYPFSGHEALLLGFLVFYLEFERIVDHVVNRGNPHCEYPNEPCLDITITFTIGAGFFISWVISLITLYFLTKEKYFKYTLQI